jgi:CRP/FNR family transcriptional regulator, dissimilatory nitrate respiration regulator
LLKRFAGQVQGYRRRLEILAIKSAQDRVLAALAEFGQDGSVMRFAATIGLSHESTYRALSALVRIGAVRRIERGKYRLSTAS